jgi:hypothetical protein
MTAHRRGEVVWYPAMFADYDRPYLVVSSDRHPYHGEEYIALAVTTSEVAGSLPIDDRAWELGTLPKPSAIKPWNPAVLKDELIRTVAGVLRRSMVDDAVAELAALCRRAPTG